MGRSGPPPGGIASPRSVVLEARDVACPKTKIRHSVAPAFAAREDARPPSQGRCDNLMLTRMLERGKAALQVPTHRPRQRGSAPLLRA